MDHQAETVVDGFRRLTDKQQTAAYVEIDAIWKAPRVNEPGPPSAGSAPPRA